jgi:hypothetical protein
MLIGLVAGYAWSVVLLSRQTRCDLRTSDAAAHEGGRLDAVAPVQNAARRARPAPRAAVTRVRRSRVKTRYALPL